MWPMCQWSRDAPVHTNAWYLQLWLWSGSFLSERSFQKLHLRVVSDIALDCCTLPMNNEQWTSDIPHIPASLQSPRRLAPNKLIGLPFILRLVNSASRENGIWVNRKLILTSYNLQEASASKYTAIRSLTLMTISWNWSQRTQSGRMSSFMAFPELITSCLFPATPGWRSSGSGGSTATCAGIPGSRASAQVAPFTSILD